MNKKTQNVEHNSSEHIMMDGKGEIEKLVNRELKWLAVSNERSKRRRRRKNGNQRSHLAAEVIVCKKIHKLRLYINCDCT